MTLKLTFSHIEFSDLTETLLFVQQTTALQSLGVYQADKRYIGYIAHESRKGSLIGKPHQLCL